MVKTTRSQRESLLKIYNRKDLGVSYKEFRKKLMPGFGYVMIEWCGMFLGIEPDGYTHS